LPWEVVPVHSPPVTAWGRLEKEIAVATGPTVVMP
jgi:hypothetical protein